MSYYEPRNIGNRSPSSLLGRRCLIRKASIAYPYIFL